MMNNKSKIFDKENVLICWNPGNYAKDLDTEGYKVATSFAEFKEKYKDQNTKRDQPNKTVKRKKKQKQEEDRIAGIVILCELKWGLSTEKEIRQSSLSAMSGIEFVMERRRQNMKIPVVFVSFLSRAQQIKLSFKNEIISTPVLGHFYETLPSNPEKWLEILNKFDQKILSKPELEDVKSHFCYQEGMLRELNHVLQKYVNLTDNVIKSDLGNLLIRINEIVEPEKASKIFELIKGTNNPNTKCNKKEKSKNTLRSLDFDDLFRRITDIVGPSSASRIAELKGLSDYTKKEFNNKIQAIIRANDDFINNLTSEELTPRELPKPIRVVFLDDEFGSDKRLDVLVDIMLKYNIEVTTYSNPDKVFLDIANDQENLIDIIVSDYRIWNHKEKPRLMDQIQGYTFLEKCSGLSRTYTYVVFSALDRNFLMKQIGILTETLYKNGVLANKYSMLNFIRNLMDWGLANQNSIASKFSKNEVFIKCYNWYRSNPKKAVIENDINNKITDLLVLFDSKVLSHMPKICFYERNGRDCSGCNLHDTISSTSFKLLTIKDFNTNYHSETEWHSSNETDITNLINKFAARRLLFYYYSKLSNFSFNCSLAKPISEQLVKSGTYNHRVKSKLVAAKNLWITKDFKKTPEELLFLQSPLHLNP